MSWTGGGCSSTLSTLLNMPLKCVVNLGQVNQPGSQPNLCYHVDASNRVFILVSHMTLWQMPIQTLSVLHSLTEGSYQGCAMFLDWVFIIKTGSDMIVMMSLWLRTSVESHYLDAVASVGVNSDSVFTVIHYHCSRVLFDPKYTFQYAQLYLPLAQPHAI